MPDYRNDTIRVRYDSKVCTQAAECVKGLPSVFDVDRKPWVNVDGAPVAEIKRQVAACPSGALSFEVLVRT
jgi:uncharacterized Fe-S cluster protein YjdI